MEEKPRQRVSSAPSAAAATCRVGRRYEVGLKDIFARQKVFHRSKAESQAVLSADREDER